MNRTSRVPGWLLVTGFALLVWSGIRPVDRLTWVLEVTPAIVGGVALAVTYRRFRFTTLAYVLIWVHALILIVGGHWTYELNPLFELIQNRFDLARNYYDRLGHVAQGFIPAIVARELLLRTSPLRPGKWLSTIVVAVCLAVSAGYELIEWAAALAIGQSADKFLATQGDVWDTQWDMFLALCGAVASLVLLSGLHNRALAAGLRISTEAEVGRSSP